jgi:hypothetical protein
MVAWCKSRKNDSSLPQLPHSAIMARLTRHHAIISPTTHAQDAVLRLASRGLDVLWCKPFARWCSCYLTWHRRQEAASVCAHSAAANPRSARPLSIKHPRAPLTSQSRRKPRSGLSLLARLAHLLHVADLLACTRPATSAWLQECPCQLRHHFHINRLAPVRHAPFLLHPFCPLAAQLQPRLSSVILTRRGSTDQDKNILAAHLSIHPTPSPTPTLLLSLLLSTWHPLLTLAASTVAAERRRP